MGYFMDCPEVEAVIKDIIALKEALLSSILTDALEDEDEEDEEILSRSESQF